MIQYDNAQIGEVVTHFVGNRPPKEYNISKNDQITLLGKTLDYFKGKEESI